MALTKYLFLLFLCHLLLLKADSKCQESFQCGNHFQLEFPFTDVKNPECGLVVVDGCDSEYPTILSGAGGFNYSILEKKSTNKFLIRDPELQFQSHNGSCFSLKNLSLPQSPYVSFAFSNLTLSKCLNQTYNEGIEEYFQNYDCQDCQNSTLYYKTEATRSPATRESSSVPTECSLIQLPKRRGPDSGDLFNLLTGEFVVDWSVSPACYKCDNGGGECLTDNENRFYCKQGVEKSRLKLILPIAISGGGALLLLCLSVSYLIWQRKKKNGGGYLLSRNISSNPSPKSDIEGGSFYFGIPTFSYTELEEATNNFDPSRVLGNGDFSTMYYGKLRDAREAAIKRLQEYNYRRVEKFLNEVKILARLRHANLVSLYGCTSRRSKELLLVYEYISNGTVADHLHGERSKEAPLTWPIRMNIAIETATALAYLHKSDIIHRDVNANNILLDNNFFVKAAGFGLLRLFPNEVTHISTAPQGTPGYIDPEYLQCYQLTDKSDVYSFGVILIELISSMPAINISRHRHEINSANLAVDRIQRCAFDELIDPSLGYDSDPEVTRMTNSVAHRCLQHEKT